MGNPGKDFEKDFQDSAIKVMDVTRLKDAPSSFNPACFKCEHKKIRFTPKNLCDYICYSYPNIFYLELKSCLKKSIPFANICKTVKDTRLFEMALKEEENIGALSFVIFNWRDVDNKTYSVRAGDVNNFINYSDRKSIPYDWTVDNGIEIDSNLKRVHYSYDIEKWLNSVK